MSALPPSGVRPLGALPLPGPPARAHRLVVAAALVAAVAGGAGLRMVPWFQDPGLQLTSDASYHERIIAATVAGGRPPARDLLCEAPQGRRLQAYLPEGLYFVAAAFHGVLATLGARNLHLNLLWFTALAGALVALPVWLATWTLTHRAAAASAAALLAVCIPGHVHRTVCYWLRYEALGTSLVMVHLAFAFRALAREPGPRWGDTPYARGSALDARASALASALFLLAAVWVWRVPLMFPLIETAFVALWVTRRGAEPAVRDWFGTVAVVGTLGLPALEYLRVQRYVLSGPWLAMLAVATTLLLPPLRPGGRARVRIPVLVAAAALGWGVGQALAPPSPYGGVIELLRFKLAMWTQPAQRPSGLFALLLQVPELYGLTPAALLIGPQQFLALGPFILAAPWLLAWARRARDEDRAAAGGTAHALLGFVTASLALVTLLVMRNKVLLAPLVAIVFGVLLAALDPRRILRTAAAPRPGRSAEARRSGSRPSATSRSAPSRAAIAGLRGALVLGALATAICGVLLAASRRSRLEPGFEACAAFLRSQPPHDRIVLTTAEFGYDVQRYAGCGTLTDGLLESRENQRRILETTSTLLQPNDAKVVELCRRYRVTHLLIPPGELLYNIASITAEPFLERLEQGLPLEGRDLDRVLVRLMLHERSAPTFEQMFESRGFRVYRIAGPAPAADRPRTPDGAVLAPSGVASKP